MLRDSFNSWMTIYSWIVALRPLAGYYLQSPTSIWNGGSPDISEMETCYQEIPEVP